MDKFDKFLHGLGSLTLVILVVFFISISQKYLLIFGISIIGLCGYLYSLYKFLNTSNPYYFVWNLISVVVFSFFLTHGLKELFEITSQTIKVTNYMIVTFLISLPLLLKYWFRKK